MNVSKISFGATIGPKLKEKFDSELKKAKNKDEPGAHFLTDEKNLREELSQIENLCPDCTVELCENPIWDSTDCFAITNNKTGSVTFKYISSALTSGFIDSVYRALVKLSEQKKNN